MKITALKKLNKKSFSLEYKESLKGYIFLIPLFIGLVYFFLIPIIQSFIYSISDVTDNASKGFSIVGFDSYKSLFTEHTSYRQTVVESVWSVVKSAPFVLIFSFFIASILNQDFVGKTFFRVVLFLPAVTSLINGSGSSVETRMGAFYNGYKDSVGDGAVAVTAQFNQYMETIGIGEGVVEVINEIFNLLYGVVDDCALQILIIFIGMQAISGALYEAADVEGATAWESFWFITFPMVSPMVFVCVIYTIVDSFTTTSSGVMNLIETTSFRSLNLSLGSAMGWIYFAIIAVLLGVITAIFSRLVFYYDS